jgi:hypothetical protein
LPVLPLFPLWFVVEIGGKLEKRLGLGYSHSIVSGTYKHLKLLDFLLAGNGFTVKYTVN